MPSSTVPGLATALTAANNAATDLLYVAIDPFTPADDRKQDRTNFFAQVPVPVGLGKPGTVLGNLLFYNTNNANPITITSDTPANPLTYILPNADPTVGQALTASAPAANVVTLTWATIAAAPGGATTEVQYNNAGAFGGITGITSNGTNLTAGSGNLRATSPRFTTNILDANGLQVIGLTATATAVNSLNIANATTTNPVTLTTVGTDTNIGLTITCAGTGVTTITGNAIINAGTGATTIGEASLGAEQLRVTSVSASRVALSVNSLANSTVDLITATQNVDDTATIANQITLTTNSNGTAAAGFGQSITRQLESSTTDGQIAFVDSVAWKVATHASRASVYRQSTVDNAATVQRRIVAPRLALTDNVATTIFSFVLPTTTGAGGTIHATVFAMANGTDENVWSGDIAYCATNNGGAISRTASVLGTPAASGSGTMTVAFAAVNSTNTISIQVTANPTTAPTAGQFYIIFSVDHNLGPDITLA